MTKPMMPNHKRLQRSKVTLLSANTPMPQNPRITQASMYMRMRVTNTNIRNMKDCRMIIMNVAIKNAVKIE